MIVVETVDLLPDRLGAFATLRAPLGLEKHVWPIRKALGLSKGDRVSYFGTDFGQYAIWNVVIHFASHEHVLAFTLTHAAVIKVYHQKIQRFKTLTP